MESGLISVDRWKSGSQAYFLTHMHSDHTRGLSAVWSHAPLFCSRTTASLFPSRFPGFDLSLLRVVSLSSWQSLSLRSPSTGSPVLLHFMAIDAHHCPGSVMFMFRGDFGCFLYTGDFRWECDDAAAAEEARTTLVAAINDFPVDILYLDNTYCNPIYSFPSRQVAAYLIADIIISHPSHDIVIGVDSLGKEDLLVHVSRILNIKIWVWPERLRTMHLLGFQDIFTTDTSLTRVRAVPRHSFSIQTLEGLNLMCPTIGIMPSGLPWLKRPPFNGDGNLSGSLLTATTFKKKTAAQQRELLQGAVHHFHHNMYSVNYSDHSCYEEIGDFIKLVKPKSMKGIVVSSSCYVDPLYYFGRICGVSLPPELLLLRPDTTREQFRAVRIKSYSTKDETIVAKKEKLRKEDDHSSLKTNKKKRARIQVKCAKIAEQKKLAAKKLAAKKLEYVHASRRGLQFARAGREIQKETMGDLGQTSSQDDINAQLIADQAQLNSTMAAITEQLSRLESRNQGQEQRPFGRNHPYLEDPRSQSEEDSSDSEPPDHGGINRPLLFSRSVPAGQHQIDQKPPSVRPSVQSKPHPVTPWSKRWFGGEAPMISLFSSTDNSHGGFIVSVWLLDAVRLGFEDNPLLRRRLRSGGAFLVPG
ncbi:hypothetical protein Bca101_058293 [Brassica carinata]